MVPSRHPVGSRVIALRLASVALLAACAHAQAPSSTAAPQLELATATAPPDDAVWRVAEVRADAPVRAPDPLHDCPSPRCGAVGSAAEVRLRAPRARVVELVARYVAAMNARSAEGLRPLFDEQVAAASGTVTREGGAFAREHVLALHARLFDQMDRRGFEASLVRVLSADECRAQRCQAALRRGDWLVEWRPTSFRASPMPGTPTAPARLVVRVRDDEARITALDDAFFGARRVF